jgi:hypothetical protein
MSKFRKKPVVIEAFQWHGEEVEGFKRVENRLPLGEHPTYGDVVPFTTPYQLLIPTLEGVMRANVGDWIITGVAGEKYPCREDIFEKTYEAVKDGE